jgi:hypothetical protein
MDKFKFSTKHIAINKANAQIVIAVGAASFITVFCLIATKTLFSQYQYQGRVISAAKTANQQLQSNITAYDGLIQSYNTFNDTRPNILGQPVNGSSNDNTQMVLDALPGAYDFPGLVSTLQNVLNVTGLGTIATIGGTDEQLTQGSDSSSSSPSPVMMPFTISGQGISYGQLQSLLQYFQQSTRPMSVDNFSLTGNDGDLTLSLSAHSYYQPAKTLNITKEMIH